MIMQDNDRYAIGQQDFKTLRERDAIYVDKTAFVEMIARSKVQYYFLARSRRFGKSLFILSGANGSIGADLTAQNERKNSDLFVVP